MKKSNKSLSKDSKQEVQILISKALKKKADSHYKYYESLVSNNVTSTVDIQDVFAPVQGLTDLNRIGDKVQVTRIKFNYALSGSSLSSGSINRVILFAWREDTNDTVPTSSTNVLNQNSSVAQLNFDAIRQKKVIILYDKLIGNEADWHGQMVFQEDIKVNLPVNFTGSTTTGYGKIYLLTLGSAAGTPPNIVGYIHVHFTDV